MTPEEAYKILGISADSDLEAIKKAYREKSLEHHPDRPDGDGDKQKQINQAREMAESAVQQRLGIVLVEQANKSLQAVELALSKDREARNFVAAREAIRSRRTQIINQFKYIVLILAGLAAFLGWFNDNLFSEFFQASTGATKDQNFESFKRAMKLMALIAGASAGVMQFVIHLIEQRLQSYTDRLEDARECADEIARSLNFESLSTVTEDQLIHSKSSVTFRGLDLPFGAFVALRQHERAKLLIPKAVEHGLLERITPNKIEPTKPREFKLKFNPNDFKPPEIKVKEQTPKEAREEAVIMMSIFSFLAVCLIGLTVYLNNKGHTYWAVLPGLLGGGFALLTLIGIVFFFDALKKGRKK